MRRALAFAGFCFLIYFLSGTGVITHVDGVVNYALARRMVDQATFRSIRTIPLWPPIPKRWSVPTGRRMRTSIRVCRC